MKRTVHRVGPVLTVLAMGLTLLAPMGTLTVIGQVDEEGGDLLRRKVRDRPLASHRPQPAQKLDPPPRVHV